MVVWTTTCGHVLELREKLEGTFKLAHLRLENSKEMHREYTNRKTTARTLVPVDQVLILLPGSHNKVIVHWKGPFRVVRTKNDLGYEAKIGDKAKLFHIDMLKMYEERQSERPEANNAC